jgi:excisionase family DNA binding protein
MPGAASSRARAPSDEVPSWDRVALGTAPRVATTPTTYDLAALWGGRDPLLRVREVAEQLGVCAATVYRLVAGGDLRHVRIVNSIRIRPEDLHAFVATRREPL